MELLLMISAPRIFAIAVACLAASGCTPIDAPVIGMTGVYSLERVEGPPLVQGVGTVIFTRHGYAERRVRYRNPDGSLSNEYLSRGEAELHQDSTISVAFRDIDPVAERPWHPEIRLTATGVELVRYGAYDGTRIVETYRRQ
jgi:hypothetical protein